MAKNVTSETNLVGLLTEMQAKMNQMLQNQNPKDTPRFIQRVEDIISDKIEIFKNLTTSKYHETLYSPKNPEIAKKYSEEVAILKEDIKNLEQTLLEKIAGLKTKLEQEAERAAQEAERAANRDKRPTRKLEERAARLETKQRGIQKKQAAETKKAAAREKAAATTIQSAVRGEQASKKFKKAKTAATNIQRIVRGKLARNLGSELKKEQAAAREKVEAAATTIQSAVRGEQASKKFKKAKTAATNIQRIVRGKLARNVGAKLQEEKATRKQAAADVSGLDDAEETRESSLSTDSTASTVVASHSSPTYEERSAQMILDPAEQSAQSQSALELKEKYSEECGLNTSSTFYRNLNTELNKTDFTKPSNVDDGKQASTSQILTAMRLACKSESFNNTDKDNKNRMLNEIADNFENAPNSESRKQLLELFILTAGTHRTPTVFGLFNKPGSETSTIKAFKKQIGALEISDHELKNVFTEKLGLSTKGPTLKS